MFNEIYLEPDKVPSHLRGGYNGKKFAVRVCESMTIPAEAGTWDGGSRETYIIKRLADGASVTATDTMSAPWDERRVDRKVTVTPGLCVVRHSTFQGKDMGLVFFLNPADAAPMLPAPATLTPVEKLVLDYTSGRKASYNGRNRYQMAQDDQRWATVKIDPFPTVADWDAAKATLIGGGYLNKAGAITPKGRNASSRI